LRVGAGGATGRGVESGEGSPHSKTNGRERVADCRFARNAAYGAEGPAA